MYRQSEVNDEGNGAPSRRTAGVMGKKRRKKACVFCKDKSGGAIDYKAVDRLKRYLSDRGKIVPRRVAGTCARHHRELSVVLRRARIMALLPYVGAGDRDRGERHERGARHERGERHERDERE